jgi:catechol 2,3-dioxygenase-like lactoylglutathione lyase family enzyme
MDFKLTRIGVVMLGAKDLARSVAFYRDQLGLTVQQQIPGFAFLDGGGVTLALSEPVARASEHMVGATELVFSVDSVRPAFEALKARGVSFVNEPRLVSPPMWAANFTDPDGHRLSIFGPE